MQNKEQMIGDAIDGLMLGDASIPHARSPYFTFAQAGIIKEDFVHDVQNILLDGGITSKFDGVHRKSDGIYVSTMWTPVSDYWAAQRKRFYPVKKKVIPEDIEVTSRSIFLEYLCDGSLGWSHNEPWLVGSSPWVELATCGFELSDIERFRSQLKKAIGLPSTSTKRNKCIYIGGRDQVVTFMEYILLGGRIPIGYKNKFRGFIV